MFDFVSRALETYLLRRLNTKPSVFFWELETCGIIRNMKKKKNGVSSKDILRAVLYLTETMATKENLVDIKIHMATTKHIEAIKDDLDIIGEDIDALKGELAHVRSEMATKENLETAKSEIIEQLQPLEVAFDKDAEIVVDYGKRIAKIERHLAIK